MTKVATYDNDESVDFSDKLFGTNQSGKNKNYGIGDLVTLINSIAGKDYIQYKFSLTDYSNIGIFTTNASETNPSAVTKLFLNKQSASKQDLTELFTKLDTLQNIVIEFRNPSNSNSFTTFKITNITSHTSYFEFDVVLYKSFSSGLLVAGTTYSAYFDVKENFEDKLSQGNYVGTAETLKTDIETRVVKVTGSSLVPDSEITKLSHLDDTTDLQKPVSTLQQAAIDAAVQANLVDSTLINGVTTSSAIPPTGNIHAIGVGAGTYTNWGGMVVPANNIGTLSRVGGVYSVYLTAFTDINKMLPWVAQSYLINSQVNHLGIDWVSNAATVAGDVPGTSSKWVNRLSAFAEKINLTTKADLISGKNKFNKDDIDILRGWYYNASGVLTSFANYSLTGFIPIKAGQTMICNTAKNGTSWSHVLFDTNKVKLSQVISTNSVTAVSDGFARFTLDITNVGSLTTTQVEEGLVTTPYEAYDLFIDKNDIKEINETAIPAVIVRNTEIIPLEVGKNKFNKDDASIINGKYFNSSGGQVTFGTWKIAHYIPVLAGQVITCNAAANNSGVYHELSDINKVKTSMVQSSLGSSVTVLADGFIRFSLSELSNLSTVQIELGSISTSYQDYIYGIPSNKIIDIETSLSEIYLPTTIPLAKGVELNIYTDGLRKITDELELKSKVNINPTTTLRGFQKGNRFNYCFNQSESGTFSINAVQQTLNGSSFGNTKQSSVLRLPNYSGSGVLNLLAIGDSISERGINHRELQNLFYKASHSPNSGADIRLFGTRVNGAVDAPNPNGFGTIKTECRGGWWTTNFLSAARAQGDSMDAPNPFWNAARSGGADTDFSWYISQLNVGDYSASPLSGIDIFMITLGTNDIGRNSVSQFITNVNSLVTKMWRDYPNCKIVICGIPPRGIGASTKSQIIDFNDALNTEFATPRTNATSGKLVFAPVSFWMDRELGYGATGISRIPNEVTIIPENSNFGDLHPHLIGCLQLADAQFSGLQYVLSL